jgi:hypothetical protein
MRTEAHENGLGYICDGDLSKALITEAKKTPERAWLAEISAVVLQQAPPSPVAAAQPVGPVLLRDGTTLPAPADVLIRPGKPAGH